MSLERSLEYYFYRNLVAIIFFTFPMAIFFTLIIRLLFVDPDIHSFEYHNNLRILHLVRLLIFPVIFLVGLLSFNSYIGKFLTYIGAVGILINSEIPPASYYYFSILSASIIIYIVFIVTYRERIRMILFPAPLKR